MPAPSPRNFSFSYTHSVTAHVLSSHHSAGFHIYQGQGQAPCLLPYRAGCGAVLHDHLLLGC